MLFIFFQAYSEEIAYSWFSRYNQISGDITNSTTSKDLFGKEYVRPNVLYPINLGYFAKQIPKAWNITIEEIIYKNTILPLYLSFMEAERANRLIADVIDGNANNVKIEIGLTTGNIFKEDANIKVCPHCYKEDIEKYSEAYIHRGHQIPGNYICSHHGKRLLKYTIPYDIDRCGYVDINKFDIEKLEEVPFYEQYKDFYIKLAKDIDYVLNGYLKGYNINTIREKYLTKLQVDWYVIFDGNIHMRDILERFNKFYPKEFLEHLESYIDVGKRKSWVSLMLTKSNNFINPIRHLLFINFLFGGVEEFINYSEVCKPFGDGLWMCLNSICEKHGKLVINEIKYRKFRNKPVGIFKCPSCGFTYSRVGPDVLESDINRLGKIEDYGELWYSKLYEMITTKGYSMRRIARELKCSHITIVKQAEKIGVHGNLNTRLTVDTKIVEKKLSEEELNKYKQKILNYIKKNPTASRQNVKENMTKECGLLYIRHRGWLETNLPKPHKKSTFSVDYKNISWNDKEKELVSVVTLALEELKNESKPKRITRTLISKKTKRVMLLNQDYLEKIPKVKEIIEENCETIEQFKLRIKD